MAEGLPLEELVEAVERARGTEDLPEEDAAAARAVAEGRDGQPLGEDLTHEPPKEKAMTAGENDNLDIRIAISKMNLPQRMKLALFGNGICRGLLIRDTNKLIQQFVLKNPKLQLKEIEEFSRNPHLSDVVLRIIANSQTWTRSYIVKANLVNNPKTPLDIALKWLRFLNLTDVKKLSKSKNVSQVIATAAKKRVAEEEKK